MPTLTETNIGKVEVGMWYGLFAPPATPPELVALLNREINDILQGEEVKKAFSTQGMDASSGTPAEFKRLVEGDARRWAGVIKAQKISAE